MKNVLKEGGVYYWGKIIGAFSGYLIGDVGGALLGLGVGHFLDRGLPAKHCLKFTHLTPAMLSQIRSEFFTALFAVMGYVSKIDDRPEQDQVTVARHIMNRIGIKEERRGEALRLFQEGQKQDFPLQTIIGQLYVTCKNEPDLLEMFVEIQLYAAHYFGRINPFAKQALLTICYQLDLGNADYNRIERLVRIEYRSPTRAPKTDRGIKMPRSHKTVFFKSKYARRKHAGLEEAYVMLNTTPEASDEEVKAAYRRLTSKHHPDKLLAQGMPDEALKSAEEKTRLIRAAYDRIREVRQF
jgi:DnaJ like chaperone protein